MFRFQLKNIHSFLKNVQRYPVQIRKYHGEKKSFPAQADVVIVGGGVAGCYTLYQLAKRGVQAVLLERFQLTCGTTWHTNGLIWRIRPNDTDIQLLNRTRDIVKDIKENSEYDPGFIENGGIFIARNQTRLDEYKRLAAIAKVYNIEHKMLTVDETLKLFPLLNAKAFIGSLYSPGDGILDPTQLCNALTRLAIETSNAQIFENCSATEIITEQCVHNEVHKIVGLRTSRGEIKTNCLVNATGAWGRELIEPFGITLPLIPMKHSYVVSEPIAGIRGTLPNVRDHDQSIVFRVQGSSIYLGGYERNPILLDSVPNDFRFGLYDLDWSTFDDHIDGAVELCPAFGHVGIKTTICGPETFTPDHKPIIGSDPRLIGLFHNCGYNSAGMMFGGGCGEQLAEWIIHGRPEFYMYNFDIRRFTPDQMANKQYAIERCHEAYAENYAAVFVHNQPLAGRKFRIDALHDELCSNAGAVMEEKSGWERPAFFFNEIVQIPEYDWYGAYGHALYTDRTYVDILKGDQTYKFSHHHDRIGAEAMSCRTSAATFNLSSFCKLLISGPDAKAALDWICTNDVNQPANTITYTCALNNRGGVEAHFTVTPIMPDDDHVISLENNESAYYIVADGSYANQTLSHINDAIHKRPFNVKIQDVTDRLGILSIQGPKSRQIVEELIEMKLSNEILPQFKSISNAWVKCSDSKVIPMRIMRIGFVGELGYELHIASENCVTAYKRLVDIGRKYGLKDAGFRAYNSLNCEAGFHLWGYDLRSDDTPVEANLNFVCRQTNVTYQGSDIVKKQQTHGASKRLVLLTLTSNIPIWGLEGVYCNGNAIGYLRRAEFGYSINKPIGKAYINLTDKMVHEWKNGAYEIDVRGNRFPADLDFKTSFKKL